MATHPNQQTTVPTFSNHPNKIDQQSNNSVHTVPPYLRLMCPFLALFAPVPMHLSLVTGQNICPIFESKCSLEEEQKKCSLEEAWWGQ
mmetsp:Transcript_69506/g.122692  ORF Transcript_69506/g.122692 Transcript_69506/m.122692 type:complete len:88 (+) Transcript_69506:605-868(+)